ncbi:MAG: DUF4124 domain-containing protein [Gammaproteobacteria bacterium]|nr:DUF4124 domain-containing protein [Gammaproteobacteria bacterium]
MKYYVILLVILINSISANATDVYRIVDENGRVQFSQFPPYKDAEKIKLRNSSTGAGDNSQNSKASLQERQSKYSDYLQSERLERKEKREQAKQKKAAMASKCHSVSAELSDMNQGGILYYDLDENGKRVYIDESRVESKKTRLRKYLEKNC